MCKGKKLVEITAGLLQATIEISKEKFDLKLT